MSARRMLSLAEVDLRLNGIEEDEGSKQARNAKSASAHNPPELIVAAAIVLCIRLLWTLEDEPRCVFASALVGLSIAFVQATLRPHRSPCNALQARRLARWHRQARQGGSEARCDDYLEVDSICNFSLSLVSPAHSEPIETLSDLQIDEYLDHLESALDKPSRPPKGAPSFVRTRRPPLAERANRHLGRQSRLLARMFGPPFDIFVACCQHRQDARLALCFHAPARCHRARTDRVPTAQALPYDRYCRSTARSDGQGASKSGSDRRRQLGTNLACRQPARTSLAQSRIRCK